MFKRHPKKLIVIAALLSAAIYLYWPGFAVELPSAPQHTLTFDSFGDPETAAINVVSIAPVMTPDDYASAAHFKTKMFAYLDAAQEKGWLNANTIVLLPEHIGTPLLMTGHKSRVYDANSIDSALIPIIARYTPEFIKNYYIFDAEAPKLAAVIRSQSKEAAMAYNLVFSSLAQQFGVTIAAGSMMIMTPGIYPDGLSYGHGPIFNAGFVFASDGKAQIDAIRQVALPPEIQQFAKTSLAEFIPTFTQNGVKYAVALGNDATDADVQTYLKTQNVDLLLSPRFHTENDASINAPFDTQPTFRWSVSSSMNGNGWGITALGSTAYADNTNYNVSQTGTGNAIIQNIWIKP